MKTRITVCAAFAAAAPYAHAADLQLAMTDPVVVTATRFPERLGDRPVNMTVITADDIRTSTAKTVPDILAQQAGISVQDFFGNNAATTTVDLRGFGVTGTQNTLILVDGRPVVDLDLSGVQWSAIPLGAIDRIEILRGAGSVLYGGGATAGVINIITVSPTQRPAGADVSLRAGSYGTREVQASATTSGARTAITAYASNLESDGFRRNNQNRQSTGLADLRWLTDAGEIAVKVGNDNQGIRLPGARMVQPSANRNDLVTDRRGAQTPLDWSQREGTRAQLDWRNRADWGEYTLGASWRGKEQRSYFDFSGSPDYRDVNLDVWSLTPRAKVQHQLFGAAATTVVGFDWYHWNYRLLRSNSTANIGRPFNRVEAEQNTRALYAQSTVELTPRTTISAGARGERLTIDARDAYDAGAPGGAFGSGAPGGSQRESLWAYEVAGRYKLGTRDALVAKTGRSYRYANIDEIYETNASFANQFQFLAPQTAQSLEAGYEWQTAPLAGRATLFQMDVKNEIHLDPFTTGVGNRNLPPSRRRGLELEGRWQATAAVGLRAAYTRTHAVFQEGVFAGGGMALSNQVIAGKTVPLVPRDRLFVSASWQATARSQLVAAVNYVGSQFMDNDEANSLGVKIPSYTVGDLKWVYKQKDFRLSAGINNVTNQKYYTYAVRSQFTADRYNAYPLPERNYSVTAEYSFR